MNLLVFLQSRRACTLTDFPEGISSCIQAVALSRELYFFLNESATCVAVNSDMFSTVHDTKLLFHKNGKRLITKRGFLSKVTFCINNCVFNSRSLAVTVQGYLEHFLSMCYTD